MRTEAASECFHSFFEFFDFLECFYASIATRSRKHRDKKKENKFLTLIIKMQILFALAIITSTAHASSVSPSRCGNTIFEQSERACMFLGMFLISFNWGRSVDSS